VRGAAGESSGDGCRPDAGSTLIEVLIALVITASAIVVLVGGMTTLFGSSIQNRQSTNAGVVARNYAESVSVAVAKPGAWCSSSYTVSYSTLPAGYAVSAAYGACPAATAVTPQFQTVTITATAPNGAIEILRTVVRSS
jgi:type II secretory pathway pseudopilin PulG